MRPVPALLAAFSLTLAVGCSKDAPAPNAETAAAAPETPETPATPETPPADADALPKWNTPKAYKHAEASLIGTLPDGVGIPVGTKAPNAAVTGLDGKPVSLAALSQDGPLLLVFYRGGW